MAQTVSYIPNLIAEERKGRSVLQGILDAMMQARLRQAAGEIARHKDLIADLKAYRS